MKLSRRQQIEKWRRYFREAMREEMNRNRRERQEALPHHAPKIIDEHGHME